MIAVFSDEEWQALCAEMDHPDWTKDPKFATLESRQQNLEELDKLIGEWTINQDDEELMFKLQAAGVPAGRISNAEDQMDKDQQLKAREYYVEREHPEVGTYHPPRQPCLLSKTPSETKRAPLLGEHNDMVFKEILGLSEDEINDLIINEILQ